MSDPTSPRILSRREAIASIGLAGVVFAQAPVSALAQEASPKPGQPVSRHLTLHALRAQTALRAGEWAETSGFHTPGDGGAALYQIAPAGADHKPNGGDIIELANGLLAILVERKAINYRMFGAMSDGVNDDGVQIKLAHAYANRHQVPLINLNGEFWIKQTNNINITTPVQWGTSIFHIDEKFNSRTTPRFTVKSDEPTLSLTANQAIKKALVEQLKPGVQIIPQLAPYAGHLFIVLDEADRIGIRTGRPGNRGWAREELFYVEEEGRIIGDIAWAFKNLTSIRAIPCSRNYLVIQGGGFYLSGDSAVGTNGESYHQNGISISRSRTILREQWMGLEPGKRDISPQPRSGFYNLREVFDVTLENIRAMPWEKLRRPPETPVPQGTYGIGGSRMLHCTFRNLTAEAGPVAWGVFGTNIAKNFRLENCRLNRFDVHFHCWNLHILNSTIGFKGITVTGGGELLIENTTRHGNNLVNFRRDYGSKWDGPIRLKGCTLKPSGSGRVSVLTMTPSDFDHKYPVGMGTSITIEDLRIDYSAAPTSKDVCWLLDTSPFSLNRFKQRLFFPQRLIFRNISVEGREQGVRLMRIPQPYHYDVRRPGSYDDSRLIANCTMHVEQVQLEKLIPAAPGDPAQAHLLIGDKKASPYVDQLALIPRITFVDCENVTLSLENCIAALFLQRCSINTVTAPGLRGELSFNECRLQPDIAKSAEVFYAVNSTLGTRFTNCTLHAPIVGGKTDPALIDRCGFLTINGPLRHYHLNTALGNEVLKALQSKRVQLSPAFIASLRSHHALES